MGWLKIKEEERFLDLSDYSRPIAIRLVRVLKDMPVTPHHVTFSYLFIGLLAAYFLSKGDYRHLLAGALFLQIKNILDGVDGSLARARNQSSRIGRFLDTNSDFLVNLAVYTALSHSIQVRSGKEGFLPYLIGGIALLFGLLQCSYFNYHYVNYRILTGGDSTSKRDERGNFFYKTPFKSVILFILQKFYLLVFGWQDWFMGKIDPVGTSQHTRGFKPAPSKGFMTMVTFLGLGTQILFLDLFALLDRPEWFFTFILGPCNLYLFGLILYRKRGIRLNAEC